MPCDPQWGSGALAGGTATPRHAITFDLWATSTVLYTYRRYIYNLYAPTVLFSSRERSGDEDDRFLSFISITGMRSFPRGPVWCSAGRVARLLCVMSAARSEEQQVKMPTQEYFDEYGKLYDHIGMLQDHQRMGAYHDAIKLGTDYFRGKVVLDVGAGTGVLSIWAAQAGASRVYAVEATDVAAHAAKMVAGHGLSDTITVIRERVEDLELPEKVDVILSEWMGYFLLRESMVQSVLLARDRWLKPGGLMYPSSARLLVATLDEPGFLPARTAEVANAMDGWAELSQELTDRYNLKLDAITDACMPPLFATSLNQPLAFAFTRPTFHDQACADDRAVCGAPWPHR